ncbi:site-specific integrase [Nitrosococcus oceani]|uniref:site-specific integrase n=1 Tax=Nitrosococcus oceani TaxID=1229 RepID=UPI0004E8FD34|nr:site-specific integrase [Nitrosococcus oceani]KFI22342.1 hypothetical protein HW44_10155 [Nitrosococcus oceani]
MATIRKRGDRWQVQIRAKGHKPVNKSFKEKKNALAWIKKTESDIERGIFLDISEAENTTFAEILDRYAREVLPDKRGRVSDLSRIKTLKAARLGEYNLIGLTPKVLSHYRDQRLTKPVCAQTVKHELNLISRVINHCLIDWGINIPYGNPVQRIRLPKVPGGRTRRLEAGEEALLLKYASESLKPIILFALETAMRRGELAKVQWEHIDFKAKSLLIPETKTGITRTIPLSSKAIGILKIIQQAEGVVPLFGKVFKLKADSITQAFDRAIGKAGKVEDLRFHDLRHEATSRLFEKGLNQMEVAAITGHQDLRMLLRYTHLKPENLATKLG